MRAKVLKCDAGDKGCVKFSFMPDGKDKEWNLKLFGADKAKVNGVKVGDTVDVSVEKNARGFWGIVSCSPISGSTQGSTTPSTTTASHGYREDPEKQKSISRAVALDKALQFVMCLIDKQQFKKGAGQDLYFATIKDYTQEFEHYLTNGEWQEGGDIPSQENTQDTTDA